MTSYKELKIVSSIMENNIYDEELDNKIYVSSDDFNFTEGYLQVHDYIFKAIAKNNVNKGSCRFDQIQLENSDLSEKKIYTFKQVNPQKDYVIENLCLSVEPHKSDKLFIYMTICMKQFIEEILTKIDGQFLVNNQKFGLLYNKIPLLFTANVGGVAGLIKKGFTKIELERTKYSKITFSDTKKDDPKMIQLFKDIIHSFIKSGMSKEEIIKIVSEKFMEKKSTKIDK